MGTERTELRHSRSRRLKHRRDFTVLRLKGDRLAKGCLIANWLPLPDGAASRLGVITSRRIGSAVVRNRSRRLLREAFRLHQHEFTAPVSVVLVARPSILGKRYRDVEQDFLSAMRSARLMKGGL